MRKKGKILITLGLLLIAAALSITGYNVYDNLRAGSAASSVLTKLEQMINKDPIPPGGRSIYDDPEMAKNHPNEIEYPDYILNPNMDMPTVTVDDHDYIGMITIPSLSMELPVMDEWSYSNLSISPCRFEGSAYLNNLIICAHNYGRHFGMIPTLKLGDEVIFTDVDGNRFSYHVKEVIKVSPMAYKELVSGEWDLTLFTCTYGGANRVTVRCVLNTDN